MAEKFDLIVRDGYIQSKDSIVDIGVIDDRIATIDSEISETGEVELNAVDNLVSPGFVDCHKHLDKAFAASGERFPKYNKESFEIEPVVNTGAEYFEATPKEDLVERATRAAKLAACHGTSHIRSHVTVDTTAGTKTAEAVIEAREEVSDIIDIEIVPYSEQAYLDEGETERILRDCMESGADIVGGMDPLYLENNIDDVLELWFEIATDFDAGIDCHIHEHGTLGNYTINRVAEFTTDYGYGGKVTVSHGLAIADVTNEQQEATLQHLEEAGVGLVTCYNSTPSTMPVKRIIDSDVRFGHGTDNDRDFVYPHGNADTLQGLLVESLMLKNDPTNYIGYRYFNTNDGLDDLWQMATYGSANILGLDDYGLEEGCMADFVVFDAPSRQWAITTQATRKYVVKRGQLIAENETIIE